MAERSRGNRALLERIRDDVHHGDISKRNVLRLIDVALAMAGDIDRLERRTDPHVLAGHE